MTRESETFRAFATRIQTHDNYENHQNKQYNLQFMLCSFNCKNSVDKDKCNYKPYISFI